MNSSLADAAEPACTSLMTTCMPGAAGDRRRAAVGREIVGGREIVRLRRRRPTARSRSPPLFASSAEAQPAAPHGTPAASHSARAANRDIASFYHGFAARTVDNGAA